MYAHNFRSTPPIWLIITFMCLLQSGQGFILVRILPLYYPITVETKAHINTSPQPALG